MCAAASYGDIRALLRFEFGYHFRRPVFWVVLGIFALLGFADAYSNGSRGNAFFFINSPSQIFQTTIWYGLFSVLAATAFVAESCVRDARVGIESLILATPVSKFRYFGLRFLAAFLVGLLAFSGYLPGMIAGSLMPGLSPYAIGPFRADAYVASYLLITLPNLCVVSAFAFALAAPSRSMVVAYAGAIVLVMIYIAAMLLVGVEQLDYDMLDLWSLADPFAYFALESQTLAWTVHQHNTLMPELSGRLLANRALWLTLAAGAWLFTYRRFDMRPERRDGKPARTPAQPPAGGALASRAPPPAGRASTWSLLWSATCFETSMVLRSRVFLMLTACGLVSLFFAAAGSRSFEHSDPSTDILIHTASMYFDYVLFAIIVVYAAELMWRDRDVGIASVLQATPAPSWLFVLSRLGALFAVITLNLLMCMAVLAVYQVTQGYYRFEPGLSAFMLFAVNGPYFYFIAVLAVFLHVAVRHKYAAIALLLLIALLQIPLDAMGLHHKILHFGESGDIGYSPMNGFGGLLNGYFWYVAYWAAVCGVLVVLACLLWPRGAVRPRVWRDASRRSRLLLAGGALAICAAGGWIVYNTAVLNPFEPPGKDLTGAQFERLFKRYEHLPMPVVVDTRVAVDMHPSQQRFVAHGRYVLENRSGRPLTEVHVATYMNLRLTRLDLEGARLIEAHPQWGYYIYRLATPLPPGARTEMTFVTRSDAPRGFRNQSDSDDLPLFAANDVVGNGSALYSPFILPVIGYTRLVEHQEAWKRAKLGLPPLQAAQGGAPGGPQRPHFVSHVVWGAADVTVSTDADQTPVASGHELKRWQQGGRNYLRVRSEGPHAGVFTLYSARYRQQVLEDAALPVELFHHPAHAGNAAFMGQQLAGLADFYRKRFGAAPFDRLRLVEFAYYPGMVFWDSGTLGLPEALAWKARRDAAGEDAIVGWLGYLLGHAWWEGRIIAAEAPGSLVIRESLSAYATNLYRREMHGRERFLQIKQGQMRDFFRALGRVDFAEPALADVGNEVLIARYKGQMMLELIEAQIGQPALLAAIRQFLDTHSGADRPYATLAGLRDAILAHSPDALRPRIHALFHDVVSYRHEVVSATLSPGQAGAYRLALQVRTRRLVAQGLGRQIDSAMDFPLPVDIRDESGRTLLRTTVAPGQHALDIAVTGRPHSVVLDPDAVFPSADRSGLARRVMPATAVRAGL